MKRAIQPMNAVWEKWILDSLNPLFCGIFRNIRIELISDIEKMIQDQWEYQDVVSVKCVKDEESQRIKCIELNCRSGGRTK